MKGGQDMTNEEQKRIFAENLNYYMQLNNKQQVDVAKDLEINPTTLNMWCKANALPSTGKIRKLADYFHIQQNRSFLHQYPSKQQVDKQH